MQFHGHGRGRHLIHHYLNVGASAAGVGLLHGRLQFAIGNDPSREPVGASQGPGQLVVVPGGQVVVWHHRFPAQQPLNQVALVVEAEDDRLQAIAAELAYLLGG